MITEIISTGEFIIIIDEGGVYNEEGDYQLFIKDILIRLGSFSHPVVGFIQTRMMPFSLRHEYKRSFHQYLRPINDDSIKELIIFYLKQIGVDFSSEEINNVSQLLDGHPYNVQFAVKYISEYGIHSIIYDPSDLIAWKRRRAEDFISKIKFVNIEIDILSILHEYRHFSSDMLMAVLSVDGAETAKSLRRLEEFCCIERRGGYFHISAPIRLAIGRDRRFKKTPEWLQAIGSAVCEAIKDYQNHDFVSVPIIESATIAVAKGASAPAFLSNMILPSHLLSIARDYYDRGKRGLCVEFCKRAYEMKHRLPRDAQVEVLRLWGLSTIRQNDMAAFHSILRELKKYRLDVARRISLFLEGFNFRVRGKYDDAETKFIDAHNISPNNQSINREIANLYCKQKRYGDAELYARAAYKIAPTNPFIIDILAETLLGQIDMGIKVNLEELDNLLSELEIYGDAPGSSFFLIRQAQQKAKSNDLKGALKSLSSAIERTPALPAPYFIRSEIMLTLNDIAGAEKDLEKINELLTDAGGFSEGEEARAQELEVRLLIEKRKFRAAKEKIEKAAFLPRVVAHRLRQQLARSIGFAPESADTKLQAWAKSFGAPGKRSRGRRRK